MLGSPDGAASMLDAVRDAPTHTPTVRELADLELLLDGAYAPLTGFLGVADLARVLAEGRLVDGTPWPVPVTLTLPAPVGAHVLVLTDPEGTPLAVMEVTEGAQPGGDGAGVATAGTAGTGAPVTVAGVVTVAGPVRRLRDPEHGAARRLRRSPAQVRAALRPGSVLAAVTERPPYRPWLEGLTRTAAGLGDAGVLLLVPVAEPGRDGLVPDALVRVVLAAAATLPTAPVVVPLPLPTSGGGDSAPGGDPAREVLRQAHVARAYGATHLLVDGGAGAAPEQAPLELVAGPPAGTVADTVAAALDAGTDLPDDLVPATVARELRAARPPRSERGLVVLLSGLSGSGKSTVARGLVDVLLERTRRRVTLLDGDVVRRVLSAGLGFSRADRDLNVRRIGWVAAEIARHGGLAVCAPIAPYAATRAEVRAMVAAAGADLVLVHVATPLDVCERRDRKGLYAKARAGLIPAFTGVSDPYEVPFDADLVLDTSAGTVDEAVGTLLDLLVAGGWVSDAERAPAAG